MAEAALTDWLLDSDPALRWQVERDLLRLPEEVWAATRARVATEGAGAQLIALQDPDGQWAGGAFFPAGFDFEGPEAQEGAGQPWTATTWTLNSLREWGLDARVLTGTASRIEANSRWEYDDLPYWDGEVDCCINSWTLSNGLWLGADVDGLVDWFLAHRLADGGWNCEWVNGSAKSSFHSTLNTLKGLLDYEQVTGDRERVRDARRSGEEYLLARGLYRRLSTSEPVAPWALRFAYPFRWFYSVLNAVRLLPRRVDPRRRPARRAHRGRDRTDPCRAAARRHLAPGAPAPRPRVVRGRRTRWGAVEVAHVLRDQGARVVGRQHPLTPSSRPPDRQIASRDEHRPACRRPARRARLVAAIRAFAEVRHTAP